MVNPEITNNDYSEVEVFNPLYQETGALLNFTGAATVAKATILGQILAVIGIATADGGNTGNGTVTALALALGGPAKVGSWILKCIDEKVNDTIATGSVTGPTGTGDGTLTELAPDSLGAPAKKGTWVVTCVEAITNSGRFQLADPDGVIVASDILIAAGAGGVIVFVGAGLTFKITDGSTDFAVGDVFSFPVTGTHGGRFQLTDPDGLVVNSRIDIASGAGGVIVFTGNGLTFTITDGGTDFANDDFFTITVTGGEKFKPFQSDNVDGSQIPNAIITYAVTTTGSGDVIVRPLIEGEVLDNVLVYTKSGDDIDTVPDGQLKTVRELMRDAGIIIREGTVIDELDNQ
ncbi:hypothetical protein KAR91_63985 [Candidatus Pacearchaeota archaeon]|nr:hypothetical protein [Candidatus Pacearchaeota archaeon]